MTNVPRTVFITGINRGLGNATAKLAATHGYNVVGTVRKQEYCAQVERILNDQVRQAGGTGSVRTVVLDADHMDHIAPDTMEALTTCDILINNIGIAADVVDAQMSIEDLDSATLDEAIKINAMVPHRLMSIAMPHMKQRGWGRVVNVSSERAWLSTYTGDRAMPAYRLSKLMLNGLTAWAAQQYAGSGVLINSVCPGWCRTDMGSEEAPDSPEQGAAKIFQLAEIADGGSTGKFFVDNQIVPF